MIDQLQKLLAPIRTRVMMMIARGEVTVVKDSGGLQRIQAKLLADEVRDALERVQQYGFTGVPMEGAQAVVLFLGGNRDHGVVIAVDDPKTRPHGDAGDSTMWTASGAKLGLKQATKNLEGVINKLKLENESHELVTVLSDLVEAIINARTTTIFGPQPLLNPADAFPLVKTRLDTFKD